MSDRAHNITACLVIVGLLVLVHFIGEHLLEQLDASRGTSRWGGRPWTIDNRKD